MPDIFQSCPRATQPSPPRSPFPDNDLELAGVLQQLLDLMAISWGADTGRSFQRAFVAVVDSESDALRILATRDMPPGFKRSADRQPPHRLDNFDQGVTGRVLRSGAPAVRRDNTGSCFCAAPIVRGHEIKGVLAVGRDNVPAGQAEDHLPLVVAMVRIMAMCLELHILCLRNEKHAAALRGENDSLRARLARQPEVRNDACPPHDPGIFSMDEQRLAALLPGQHPAIREIRRQVSNVAPTMAPVLLLGESGVGKRLVAERIHSLSERRHQPFVAVDCSAMGPEQLEIELLGMQAPQAVARRVTGRPDWPDRPGRLEDAHKGTLYLHEISEMPLSLQAKLLQIMQDKTVRRMDETRTGPGRPADVRILSGSSHALETLVQQGRFRPDLFYRLNIFPIPIPPLRERQEDIPRLLNHFLRNIRETCDRNLYFTRGALKTLRTYHWPGNVQEMEELLQHLAALAENDEIENSMLLPLLAPQCEAAASMQHGPTLRDMERGEILASLRRNDWIQHRAARDLGITQRQMGYRVRKFKLEGIIAEERAKLRQRKHRGRSG
jgi:Nif-specific regulatory protein